MGTADGPEWAANSAASKEATTWLAANRADEWKKVTDEKGGLIRNAQTAPEIIRLLREYGKAKGAVMRSPVAAHAYLSSGGPIVPVPRFSLVRPCLPAASAWRAPTPASAPGSGC